MGLLLLWLNAGAFAAGTSMFRDGLEPSDSAAIDWMGDEFDEAATLSDFSRIWRTEHWPFDQLQQIQIGASPGQLTLEPFSSGWWEDFRAELTYKEITGDLIATTLVYPRNRGGTGAPGSSNGGALETEYSLAGLMLRAPRRDVEASNSTWVRGREAYVFLSMGAADLPGSYQFEDKTTRAALAGETHSVSVRLITNAAGGVNAAYLRLVRVGAHVLLLVQPVGGGSPGWQVLRRFHRPDLPGRLQLGFVAYTDWATMRFCSYEHHNLNLLSQSCDGVPQPADPDLNARFEFLRLQRPQLPPALIGADLSNPAAVSDADLLAAFGFAP
jgi:hypothetical protein